MDQLAVATEGRGADVNAALGELAPFAEDTSTLLRILNAQQPTVRRARRRHRHGLRRALASATGSCAASSRTRNRVFATTAARNQELADTFRVLPTFERESTLTVNRLAAFARTANPLVTQLRPAARQLSPTLEELSALAPDLKALFREPRPADRRVGARAAGAHAVQRRAAPAPRRDRRAAAPAQPDPRLRRRVPQGAHRLLRQRRSRSTQATTGVGADAVHYLRTTNPVNPENLAVYPRRIGTNRPEPVPVPGRVHGARVRAAAVRDAPLRARGPDARDPAAARRDAPARADADPDDPGPAADRAAGGPGRLGPDGADPGARSPANIQRLLLGDRGRRRSRRRQCRQQVAVHGRRASATQFPHVRASAGTGPRAEAARAGRRQRDHDPRVPSPRAPVARAAVR